MIIKKKIKLLIPLALLGCMLYSVIALGAEDTVERNNGEYALTCTIKYETKSGGAKTKGAPSGKCQTANVTIYDANGVSLGATTNNTPYNKTASASVSTSKTVNKVVTGHFVTKGEEDHFEPEYPLYQQVQLVKYPKQQ
ncbi:MAG: hypothetical protein HDT40_02620 [Lachnospiraceae bacterium]|nr:hypothetical protein [Lachnospiraceae bacterium]